MVSHTVRADMAQIPLFQGLPAVDATRLAASLRTVDVKPGTNVMTLEQPGETVYFLVSGMVRLQAEQADGATVILGFLGPGDMVGEMSLLDAEGRSATVYTLEPCRLLWMDRVTFQAMLESSPRLAINLLRVLSRRLRQANDRVQVLVTKDVSGRVARQLAAFAERFGEPLPEGGERIRMRLTQENLADIVGSSRERVCQVLKPMKRAQLVHETREHLFTVVDREALVRRFG